jgi:vacuolar protein sorting-associated protein 3
VLCRGTVSFYTLPELSPAPNGREVHGCQWVGGLDQNHEETGLGEGDIMVANSRRITIVKVADKIQALKTIQFPGCLRSVRRDTIACVADSQKYALLEVEHQQKIPLFSISSLSHQSEDQAGQVEDLLVQETTLPARGSSLAPHGVRAGASPAHGRSTSLGIFAAGLGKMPSSLKADLSAEERSTSPDSRTSNRSPNRISSEVSKSSSNRHSSQDLEQGVLSPTPAQVTPGSDPQSQEAILPPHILSVTPSEFLLTTGTTADEPGVGMFVNMEGDVVRGTIEFQSYPESVVLDRHVGANDPSHSGEEIAGSLCALLPVKENARSRKVIQILPLAAGLAESARSGHCVSLPEESSHAGLQCTTSGMSQTFHAVAQLLRLVRVHLKIDSGSAQSEDYMLELDAKRNREEAVFAQSLGKTECQVVVWSGNDVYCLSANPVILQMENRLETLESLGDMDSVIQIFTDLRQKEAQTETDFLSFNYIRQRASLKVFMALLSSDLSRATVATMKTVESLLVESNLDPRVVMLFFPIMEQEVLQGPLGIWLPGGLARSLEHALEHGKNEAGDGLLDFWQMIKRYLVAWQDKRGFGSIADEQYVFDSVDAALLHVLLHLEESLPRGSPTASSVRAKLNNVVDNWGGNFDRAIVLLERYRRLFALSRLYQSRRLARKVLATWRRVIDGEIDSVGELNPESAEVQIRRYLVNLRDAALVQEYLIWLATKNPELAVEVFTDVKSRVKFTPSQALQLLKQDAPGAVQHYLEHLVFSKGNTEYTDDLIGYYLDSVISVLESSEKARNSLAQSYSTYRTLEAPKPTYINFIRDNAPSQPWWKSRLRLLQLLGGGNYASGSTSSESELTYSIPTVLARLAPFSSYLVSESIILDARQGRHREALRLLTHGLGDYDTAVRYCYFAGPQSATSFPIDESQLPSFEEQRDLFNALFDEFLSIEDLAIRLERSSELLAKFANWFDPFVVLDRVPEEWSLGLVSEFLLRTMRALRGEMLEASVVKTLSAAENLRVQMEFVEACERMGARVETEKGLESRAERLNFDLVVR